jgi:F-type H+-transporting ATPase subunit b
MTIFSTPDFWVAVSFVLFILVLLYFRVPGRITAALDRRAESIRNELEEARKLREEAQAILADYQRKHKDVEKEADEIVRLAREEAEALAAETRAKLKESLERRAQLAEDKIARAEEQAMNEVRATAVDVATAAAERIIAQKMTPTASAKLVNDSIKGLKDRLN